MEKINWSRVFLGGLVWWVIGTLLWAAALFLYLDTEVTAVWKVLGLQVQVLRTPGFAVFWLVSSYVNGLVAIWLYAAVRPRYGPGPKTAVGAGLAFWLIGTFLPMMFLGSAGVFPMRFVAMDSVTKLVLIVAATVVGAWLYKEE